VAASKVGLVLAAIVSNGRSFDRELGKLRYQCRGRCTKRRVNVVPAVSSSGGFSTSKGFHLKLQCGTFRGSNGEPSNKPVESSGSVELFNHASKFDRLGNVSPNRLAEADLSTTYNPSAGRLRE